MDNKITTEHLLKAVENLLAVENFCNTCSNNHPRVVSENCTDCAAGIPINFKYDRINYEQT